MAISQKRIEKLVERGTLLLTLCKTEVTRVAALGLQSVPHKENPAQNADNPCYYFASFENWTSSPFQQFLALIKAGNKSVPSTALAKNTDATIDRRNEACHKVSPSQILAAAANIATPSSIRSVPGQPSL